MGHRPFPAIVYTILVCVVLAVGAFACSTDGVGNETNDCETTADCDDGEVCVDDTCEPDPNSDEPDAGVDADDPDADDGLDGGEPDDTGPLDTDPGPDAATDTGPDTEPEPSCENATTCEEADVQCGTIADGCGDTLDCGGCPVGEICGTDEDSGQCVADPCTPEGSCEEAQLQCGSLADGCGGTIDCGSCDAGENCVSGTCQETSCDPMTCEDHDPGECGPHPDGCGDFIDCGSCDAGQFCGVGNDRGACEDIACDPLDCDAYDPGECGPHPDGCGGVIDCGNCDEGKLCGSGDERGECVEPSCDPLTCADYPEVNCGPVSDGCGGVTDSCGTCQDPEICGGGGVPNVCGADAQGNCDGGLCEDQVICPGGEATTLTGTVYAPNAELPIPNAVVYVPQVPLSELPSLDTGPICQQCEDEDLGDPLVGTITDFDGTFELRHVPAGVEFPLVIKIGDWRRVVTISPRDDCSSTELDAEQTRLPTTQHEGTVHDNIPHTAVSTGGVDAMECVLHKLGVEASEFTRHSEDGRIHLYRANGGVPDQELANACANAPCYNSFFGYVYCTDHDPDSCGSGSQANLLRDNLAYHLYSEQEQLDSYDMVVMDCEGIDHSDQRSSGDLERILNYVNAGGRLFASHYAYSWLHNTSELQETATWNGSENFNDDSLAFVDDSFFGGSVLWDWLQLVDADYPTSGPNGEPQVEITDPRTFVQAADPDLATRWVHTDASAPGHINQDSIQQYGFQTPVFADESQQCGQVAYSAFHVTTAFTAQGPAFPDYCGDMELTPQEKILAYMLFDLAACVSEEDEPSAPECTPLSCSDVDAECGQISDGCGDIVECGQCPSGTACGGGGQPNQCGGGCTALTCEDHGAECGDVSDGCGGTIDCGECPGSTICGAGGQANQCECQPMSCEDHGAECGQVSDGCGNTLDCGECPEGSTCGAGEDPNMCSDECTQLTCADHGAECGEVADGCGGVLDCGDCPDPQTCGGDGELNQCGCTPLSCQDHNAECGNVSDGCGNTLDCGDCPDQLVCDQLQCVSEQCLPSGATCEENWQCCSDICAVTSSSEEGECIDG